MVAVVVVVVVVDAEIYRLSGRWKWAMVTQMASDLIFATIIL